MPSNVAEKSDSVYRYHGAIALGSQGELDTCLEIAVRLNYLPPEKAHPLQVECSRVGQLLNGLHRSFREPPPNR